MTVYLVHSMSEYGGATTIIHGLFASKKDAENVRKNIDKSIVYITPLQLRPSSNCKSYSMEDMLTFIENMEVIID